MQSYPPKWQTLVLVCNNQRPPDAPKPSCGPQGGARLRDELKAALMAEGLWGRVRVVSTGCLDICLKGVTVVLDGGARRLVLDPELEKDALLAEISASLDRT